MSPDDDRQSLSLCLDSWHISVGQLYVQVWCGEPSLFFGEFVGIHLGSSCQVFDLMGIHSH